MKDSKFYYSGKHPAVLKSLVYQIECGKKYMSGGIAYVYTISFYLVHQEQVITWSFEAEDIRDRVYGNVLDASMTQ